MGPLRDRLSRRDPVARQRQPVRRRRGHARASRRRGVGAGGGRGAARGAPGRSPRSARSPRRGARGRASPPCRHSPARIIRRQRDPEVRKEKEEPRARGRGSGPGGRTRAGLGRSSVRTATCFSQKERRSSRSCRCVTTIAGSYQSMPPRAQTASAKAVSSPGWTPGSARRPTAIAPVDDRHGRNVRLWRRRRGRDPLGVVEEVVELAVAARATVDDAAADAGDPRVGLEPPAARASQSGGATASASRKARSSPRSPRCRRCARRPRCAASRSMSTRAPARRATSADASSEASSTTMTSSGRGICASTEATASPTVAAPFRHGITTDTFTSQA